MRTVGLVHVAWTCRSKNIDLEGWLLVLLLLVTLCRECNIGSQNMSYVGIIHDFNYKWLYNSEFNIRTRHAKEELFESILLYTKNKLRIKNQEPFVNL